MSDYVYGHVKEVDAFALQTIDFFLNDSAYRRMPLLSTKIQLDCIQRGDYLCQFDAQGRVLAFMTYIRISRDSALKAIADNRPPSLTEARKVGEAVFICAITGQQTAKLARQFFMMWRGRKVLYCRHMRQGKRLETYNLVYIDEQGRRKRC